jgi:hypothetical protein
MESNMTKTKKQITTVPQMIKAYGGVKATAKKFWITEKQVRLWVKHDWPPRHFQLGILLGLQARGYEVSPKLMGVRSWEDIPGVGLPK